MLSIFFEVRGKIRAIGALSSGNMSPINSDVFFRDPDFMQSGIAASGQSAV